MKFFYSINESGRSKNPPRLRVFLAVVFAVLSQGFSCSEGSGQDKRADFRTARLDMVERQLRQRGIRDERVLQVMNEIPRHLFVPESWRSWAYIDGPLPIGEEQTISQPYIVALMSESLELQGPETVLEIGTGSGYQAAVLSRLAKQVYSIEIIPQLAETARARLSSLSYANVSVIVGDGNLGWLQASPYSAIMVTAAAPQIPQALLDQLAEGGRMVLPVVVDGGEQQLVRLRKQGGVIKRENLGAVRFVPLVEGKP
ncbi:MAG: protein-L-isoaspartate(D-aspartate) O-methyltransferase [Candidatus Binatia bacterium]